MALLEGWAEKARAAQKMKHGHMLEVGTSLIVSTIKIEDEANKNMETITDSKRNNDLF